MTRNPMWHLDKMLDEARAELKANPPPLPTGPQAEQCRDLIRRCEERDASLLENALAAEAEGDTQGCWFAMAARAENNRFKERLQRDLAKLENAKGHTADSL